MTDDPHSPKPSPAVAFLEGLRADHAARRLEAGFPPDEVPAGGVDVTITADGPVRTRPSVDDDAIVQAVLAARAVVELDDRHWRAQVDRARVQQQLEQTRADLTSASAARRTSDNRLQAVLWLHREATETEWSCGDECQCTDERPLGVCARCGDPYPCDTARAALGEQAAGDRVAPQAPDDGPALDPRTVILCPVCGLASVHPDDVRDGYCGHCHVQTRGEVVRLSVVPKWRVQLTQPIAGRLTAGHVVAVPAHAPFGGPVVSVVTVIPPKATEPGA